MRPLNNRPIEKQGGDYSSIENGCLGVNWNQASRIVWWSLHFLFSRLDRHFQQPVVVFRPLDGRPSSSSMSAPWRWRSGVAPGVGRDRPPVLEARQHVQCFRLRPGVKAGTKVHSQRSRFLLCSNRRLRPSCLHLSPAGCYHQSAEKSKDGGDRGRHC